MGTHFKMHIFEEQLQAPIAYWAEIEKTKGPKGESHASQEGSHNDSEGGVQLGSLFKRASVPEANANAPREDRSN